MADEIKFHEDNLKDFAIWIGDTLGIQDRKPKVWEMNDKGVNAAGVSVVYNGPDKELADSDTNIAAMARNEALRSKTIGETSIKIDEDTGKITVKAPKGVVESESFKKAVQQDVLKQISQAYRLNREYKLPYNEYDEETGKTKETEITIPEYVQKLNDDLKKIAENVSTANNIRAYYATRYSNGARNLTDSQVQMSTDYKNGYIPVPSFLMNRKGLLGIEHFVQNGYIKEDDFKKFFYNRDNVGREEIAAWIVGIDNALKNKHWSQDEMFTPEEGEEESEDLFNTYNANELAKAIAFRNYIIANDPEQTWIQSVGANLESLLSNALYGADRVFFNIANVGQKAVTFGQGTEVQNYIGEMDSAFSTYNEQQKLINDSTATTAWLGQVGGAIGGSIMSAKVGKAIIRDVGNAASSAYVGAFNKGMSGAMEAAGIQPGSAAASALTSDTILTMAAEHGYEIARGAAFAIKTMPYVAKVSLVTNLAHAFMNQHATLNFATKFLMDTFHDALVFDSTTLFNALQSSDQDVRNYWMGQLVDNGKWWLGTAGARSLVKFSGKTTIGKWINAHATKNINKFEAWAGNKWANFKDRVNGGSLAQKIQSKLDEAIAANKPRQAKRLRTKLQQLEFDKQLRSAREVLGNIELERQPGTLKFTDSTTAKYLEQTNAVRALNVSVDTYNRSVDFKRQEMLGMIPKDPYTGLKNLYINPGLGGANTKVSEFYFELARMNNAAGLGGGPNGSMISQDVANYLVGQYEYRRYAGLTSKEAQDAAAQAAENLKIYASKIPDNIRKFIDDNKNIYSEFYDELNQYAISKKLLDKNRIEGYNNETWNNIGGYQPVIRLQESAQRGNVRIDTGGDVAAVIEQEMRSLTNKVDEVPNYVDPELIRQSRINRIAQAEINRSMLDNYVANTGAAFSQFITGEETEYARLVTEGRKTVKKAIDEATTNFVEDFQVNIVDASKMPKKSSGRSISPAKRMKVVDGMTFADTTDALTDMGIIYSGDQYMTSGVTADNFEEWFNNALNDNARSYVRSSLADYGPSYKSDIAKREEINSIKSFISQREAEIESRSPKTDAKKVVPGLDFEERNRLAKSYASQHPEYVVAYRRQNTGVDDWYSNGTGKGKGNVKEFDTYGSDKGDLKNAVWLTTDESWATSQAKASAGNYNGEPDQIVVVLIPRDSIVDAGSEFPKNAKGKRVDLKDFSKENGGKVVQTRATQSLAWEDARDANMRAGRTPITSKMQDRLNPEFYSKQELVLFKDYAPNTLDDSNALLLGEYNKQFDDRVNKKVIGNIKRDIETNKAEIRRLEGEIEADKANTSVTYKNLKIAMYNGGRDFEYGLRRAFLAGSDDFAKSGMMRDAAKRYRIGREAFRDGVFVAKARDALSGIPWKDTDNYVLDLFDTFESATDNFIERLSKHEGIRKAVGVMGGSNATDVEIEHYLLKRLQSNSGDVHASIEQQIREMVKGADMSSDDVERLIEVSNELFDDYVTSRINEDALAIRDSGRQAVDPQEAYEKAKEINDRIVNAQKEVDVRYSSTGAIMYVDAAGRQAFATVDPAFASLYNRRIIIEGGDASALAKVNAVMSKTFRYGTTSVNLSSAGNQLFRDFSNAMLVGGAWRTIKQYADDLEEVFGKKIVEQIKSFDPTGYEIKQLSMLADQMGVSIDKAAVSRELMRGAAIAPSSTERTLYGRLWKELKNDSNTKLDALYDKSKEILKKYNPDELINGTRENYLRNRVYAANLNDAMKAGYSVRDARIVAEFTMNNATTNFGRQLYHLQSIAESTPYFRAAINGTKSFWRMWSLDPVGISGRITGGLILPTMYLVGASLATKENREIYKNIPEYQKEDSLVFVINGEIMSLPMPQELSSLVAPFRQFVEYLHDSQENNFWELMTNDLLGYLPVDLRGFTSIDMNVMSGDPTILDRMNRGVSRVFSQVAPVPIKTMYMLGTGTDPYTGKSMYDPSYWYWDDEAGSLQLMDYSQTKIGTILAKAGLLGGNANVWSKVLSGVFGNTGLDVLNDLAELFTEGPEKAFNTAAETALERLTGPFNVPKYNLIDSQWKAAVRSLTAEKEAILKNPEVQALNSKLAQTKDPEERKKILAERENYVGDYRKKVAETARRLTENFGGGFDRLKFAAVIQLLNFSTDSSWQAGSQESSSDASSLFYSGRDAALSMMSQMGITASDDLSVFGYATKDKDGNIVIKYNTPATILDLKNTQMGESDYHLGNIKAIVSQNGLYEKHKSVSDQIGKIYDKNKLTNSDYQTIEAIQINWNAEVAKALADYIDRYSAEAAINNKQVRDYLKTYIEVPASWEKNNKGRRVYGKTLGDRGSLKDAYYSSWLKSMFNINDPYKGQY